VTGESEAFKARQRQVWSVGDYGAMAEQYQLSADRLVQRLEIGAGMRVLDIATGTGNAAIAAAITGAEVVGIDLTPELFDEAHWRADELGLAIAWQEGDAEALPYPDGWFDRAVSAFGIMFAPDPHAAARELVRVLRPGGRFGMANWSLRGPVLAVFEAVAGGQVALPASAAHPMPWGEPQAVRTFFDDLGVELEFAHDHVSWVFADADDGVRWLEEVSGAVIAAKAVLEPRGEWAPVRARLVDAVTQLTRPDIEGVWVQAEYLVTLGRKA